MKKGLKFHHIVDNFKIIYVLSEFIEKNFGIFRDNLEMEKKLTKFRQFLRSRHIMGFFSVKKQPRSWI